MLDMVRARRALEKTAKANGMSYEEIIKEIEETIAEAIENCKRTNNRSALALWATIPCAGDVPTPLELVAYLGAVVKNGSAQNSVFSYEDKTKFYS